MAVAGAWAEPAESSDTGFVAGAHGERDVAYFCSSKMLCGGQIKWHANGLGWVLIPCPNHTVLSRPLSAQASTI